MKSEPYTHASPVKKTRRVGFISRPQKLKSAQVKEKEPPNPDSDAAQLRKLVAYVHSETNCAVMVTNNNLFLKRLV